MSHNRRPVTEAERAVALLSVARSGRFDDSDMRVWKNALDEHDHSGLTTEAARRFTEEDAYQDVPLTVSSFLRAVKQVRAERIAAAVAVYPQPPSGISDEQYRRWLAVRNECAVRLLSPEDADAQLRREINVSAAKPISGRPAITLYQPPAP